MIEKKRFKNQKRINPFRLHLQTGKNKFFFLSAIKKKGKTITILYSWQHWRALRSSPKEKEIFDKRRWSWAQRWEKEGWYTHWLYTTNSHHNLISLGNLSSKWDSARCFTRNQLYLSERKKKSFIHSILL